MKSMNLVIRGFLYKEGWTPLSSRNRHGSYTINFLKCMDGYRNLIDNFSRKYKLKIYLTSYDTTPPEVFDKIKQTFYVEDIFTIPEAGSSQFSAPYDGLNKIESLQKTSDLTVLIRGDLLMTNEMISIVSNYEYTQDDCVYALIKEGHFEASAASGSYTIDVIHVIPKAMMQAFQGYLYSGVGRNPINSLHTDCHNIHEVINTVCISEYDAEGCPKNECCGRFFKIYQG